MKNLAQREESEPPEVWHDRNMVLCTFHTIGAGGAIWRGSPHGEPLKGRGRPVSASDAEKERWRLLQPTGLGYNVALARITEGGPRVVPVRPVRMHKHPFRPGFP